MKNYVCFGYGKKFEFNDIIRPFNLKKDISIIVPTYNEEGNIERFTKALQKVMGKTKFRNNYEIVIVDDNSKDKTPKIIDRLAKRRGTIAIHRYGKKGLFSAFRDGIFIANGKHVVIMDSDFAHPPEMIPKLMKYKDNYDIVLGSRFMKGGGMGDTFIATNGSRMINKVCAFIMGLPFSDVGCNFHVMNRDKFNKLKFKYEPKFGEFDFELLYRAYRDGFKMKEIPFVLGLRDEGESKMGNKLKMSYYYFKRALQLRFLD